MSVAIIGQMGHLSMSLQVVCEHFVTNRVVMEDFMHGNVDNFICKDTRIFLVKDVRVR